MEIVKLTDDYFSDQMLKGWEYHVSYDLISGETWSWNIKDTSFSYSASLEWLRVSTLL